MNFSKKNHEHLTTNKNEVSKTIKNTLLISYLVTLLFISCSSEDEGPTFTPSASDINTTYDEYPSDGTIIGTVTTNMTGTLHFSISSQSVAGAFMINSITGEVAVDESRKFDFETNPTLGATVTVTNSSETATGSVSVILNDIDDIAYFLNTSKQAYLDANNNDWIKVTEEEYNMLSSSLNNVTKNGTTDDQYDYSNTITPVDLAGNSNITIANDNDVIIPQNSYCFAFKYYAVNGPTANITNVKVSSTTATTSYQNLGNPLPIISVVGAHYFVLKSNNTPTPETSYLAIFTNLWIGYKIIDIPTDYHYSFSDAGNLGTVGGTSSALIMYQGLSTTQKQWD